MKNTWVVLGVIGVIWIVAITTVAVLGLVYALSNQQTGVLGVSYVAKDVIDPHKVKAGDEWETGAEFREGTVFETVNTSTLEHAYYRVGKNGSSRIDNVNYVLHLNNVDMQFSAKEDAKYTHTPGYELLTDFGNEYSEHVDASSRIGSDKLDKLENSNNVFDTLSYQFPDQGQDWYRYPPFPAGLSSTGPRIHGRKFGLSPSLSGSTWRRFGWPEWKRWRHYVNSGGFRILRGTFILLQKTYVKKEYDPIPDDLAFLLDTSVNIVWKGITYTQTLTLLNPELLKITVSGVLDGTTSRVTLTIPLKQLRAYFSTSRKWHEFSKVDGSPSYLRCNHSGWMHKDRVDITIGFGRQFDFVST